jgi:hypothetical protein
MEYLTKIKMCFTISIGIHPQKKSTQTVVRVLLLECVDASPITRP